MPLSTFLFDSLMPQVDLSTRDGRTKLATLALPLISQIPGETLRIYMRQTLGNKLGILDDNQLDKLMPKQAESGTAPVAPPMKRTTMRVLIALLIQNPQLASMVPSLDGLSESKMPGLPLFIELVGRCNENPGLTTGQLLELYRGTNFSQTLETLAIWNHMIVDEEAEAVFQDSLASVYDSALEERLEFLIARERTQGLSADERRELWTLSQAFARK